MKLRIASLALTTAVLGLISCGAQAQTEQNGVRDAIAARYPVPDPHAPETWGQLRNGDLWTTYCYDREHGWSLDAFFSTCHVGGGCSTHCGESMVSVFRGLLGLQACHSACAANKQLAPETSEPIAPTPPPPVADPPTVDPPAVRLPANPIPRNDVPRNQLPQTGRDATSARDINVNLGDFIRTR